MHYDEMKCGLLVRVINFHSENGERPEHWSPDMDEWRDVPVTISECDGDYVYIEEDEGAWSWYPSDFQSYCSLDHNDPNLVYKRYRKEEFTKQLRAQWAEKQALLKKKGLS